MVETGNFSRSAERTPVSKHASPKDTEKSPRTSGMNCPTPEFRMSVLLARDENSGSQKDLRSRSPAARSKVIGRPRDKTALRTRDTLRLVNEKQSPAIDEVKLVDLDQFLSSSISCAYFHRVKTTIAKLKNYLLYWTPLRVQKHWTPTFILCTTCSLSTTWISTMN